MDKYLGSVVTLIVGFVALAVYQKQKRDQKKNAANILLIELENAERQLQIINDGGDVDSLAENIYLMPSASWSKYRHLFARDFDAREWDTLTDFYNKCAQFDEAARYNSSFFRQNVEAFRESINRALANYAMELAKALPVVAKEDDFTNAQTDYLRVRDRAIDLYMRPSNLYMYGPQKPINDAVAALKNLDTNISLGTIGIKLKAMSKQGRLARIFGSIRK